MKLANNENVIKKTKRKGVAISFLIIRKFF